MACILLFSLLLRFFFNVLHFLFLGASPLLISPSSSPLLLFSFEPWDALESSCGGIEAASNLVVAVLSRNGTRKRNGVLLKGLLCSSPLSVVVRVWIHCWTRNDIWSVIRRRERKFIMTKIFNNRNLWILLTEKHFLTMRKLESGSWCCRIRSISARSACGSSRSFSRRNQYEFCAFWQNTEILLAKLHHFQIRLT